MKTHFEKAFDSIFGPPYLDDRTEEVQAQNKRLKANRLETKRRGSMATPLRPTEESESASDIYSEATRSES